MARVLIVGSDGLIGADLVNLFSDLGWTVFCTSRRKEPSISSWIYLDLAAVNPHVWPLPQVDLAIFVAAMARFADCRARPDLARRINVEVPIILAQRLALTGTRVILISTSAVFDGSIPDVLPQTRPNPTSLYGMLKSEAEQAFLALRDLGGVVRLTKVLTSFHPLFRGWIDALRDGAMVEAFRDLNMAPISLQDVRSGVSACMTDGGIVQVSGAYDINYFQCLSHIASRLKVRNGLIRSSSAAEKGIQASERPANTSLNTDILKSKRWISPEPFSLIDQLYIDGMT